MSPTRIIFSPHLSSSRGSGGSGGLIGLLEMLLFSVAPSLEFFSENIEDLSLTSSGFGDLHPGPRIIDEERYIQ